jgi:hypothetical protein
VGNKSLYNKIPSSQFGIGGDKVSTKELTIDTNDQPPQTKVILQGNSATAGEITVVLPSTSGTLSYGGTTNAFETIQTPLGTSPVATSAFDVLTMSSGSGITITGNAATDTITYAIDPSALPANGAQSGFLSSTDWSTFNGKQAALGYFPANDQLSNLATTAINSNLLPDTDGFYNVGLTGQNWDHVNTRVIGFDGVTQFDFVNSKINDTAGLQALKIDDRTAFDVAGAVSLSWNSRTLNDSTGAESANWQLRHLSDDSALLSLDWLDRRLFALDGTTANFDWSSATGPTTLTQTRGDDTTKVATTAFVAAKFRGTAASDSSPNVEQLSAAGWTSTGWTGSFAAGFTNVPTNVSSLTNTVVFTAGVYYKVTLTITGRTAGTISTDIGGVNYDSGTSASYTFNVLPSVTGTLSITPTSTFNGTVVVSIVTNSVPTSIFYNSTGTDGLELRSPTNTANVFLGKFAGASNTIGYNSVFVGNQAGGANVEGGGHTAVGSEAMAAFIGGPSTVGHTAIGRQALRFMRSSTFENVAVGSYALYSLQSGNGGNTAVGNSVLGYLLTGQYNTGVGYQALLNCTGNENTALGMSSLLALTSGAQNTAIGRLSGFNATGSGNTFVGYQAGRTITSTSNNTFVGLSAGFNGSQLATATNSIAIGNGSYTTASNQMVLGFTTITSIGLGMIPATTVKLDVSDTTLAASGALAGTLLNLAQTWNTTGIPTAIKLNVTDTASNAASALLDLQVGGVSKFKVDKLGQLTGVFGVSTGGAFITSSYSSAAQFYSRGAAIDNVGGFRALSNWAPTSGTNYGVSIYSGTGYAPTSGTGIFNAYEYIGTINQTGGANGVTRGLYINPTITAAADFRAIETTAGKVVFWATNTASGTTGAQTINKTSGTVNFAAAATSLVVTNSLVTTASIIMCVVRTNDTTATIKNVVPAAGSFTINLSTAATAETSVGFMVIN